MPSKTRHLHPLNSIWHCMLARCRNPNNKAYRHYGGKGISICAEWLGFRSFVASIEASIGPRPSRRHTLDRIDSAGNYEPGNVRWATQAEQLRNQTRNHRITFNGETLCLTDWANRTGIAKWTLRSRIVLLGWPIEKALTTPTARRRWQAAAPSLP